MVVTLKTTAVNSFSMLLTTTVLVDMVVKKSRAMVASKSRATAVSKSRATAVKSTLVAPTTAVKSLLVRAMNPIPPVDTVVPKALSMVVSVLSDLMALLAFREVSVGRMMNTARGGKSMALVDLVVSMEAPADTAMRVMEGDIKHDVPQVGYLMLMCCGKRTVLT
jgi:hypothetical protein